MSARRLWVPLIAIRGPILFVLVFLIEGAIRPGYSALDEYVSALALGPRGWVQITSFIVCGAAIMLLARLTAQAHGRSRAGRAGAIMLGIIGLALLLSGPFVMDAAGTPLSGESWHGLIHGILGGIVFLLMPVVPFVLFGQLRSQCSAWWLTLVLAVIITMADLVFIAVTKSPDLAAATAPWAGLIQRSVLLPFMAWCVVLGLSLRAKEIARQ